MQRIGFGQPDVPVNPRALVEPSVAKAGIDACHDAILRSDCEKIRDVEAEGRVTVVVAADEAAVHEHQHVAKGPVELKIDATPRIARRNFELLPVPAHAGLRIAPSQRFVPVRLQRFIAHEGQLHRPVVRQIERAPFRVVESNFCKLEVAGFGKVFLILAESEIAGRVAAMPEDELPSEIKEKLFARSDCGWRGARACDLRVLSKQRGRARPRGARHQAGGGKRQS